MNVVLLTSHAIAEHDDLDMFTRMGVPCYSIGGAYDAVPFEGMRPAIPGVVRYPELEAATERQRQGLARTFGDPGPRIDWGKAVLADDVLDWADTIIVHHFPEWWIGGQWNRIHGKRVIWRTCGQSNPDLERFMLPLRMDGLQVVRYSPHEREFFGSLHAFAGEDAMIRFGKDPAEWTGWTGADAVVGNVTQDMPGRGEACGYAYWQAATEDLPVRPAGPGSGVMRGGHGALDYEDMREYLRDVRVYLYTGTRPASYTLGLMEAMLTGTPVVAMPAASFAPPGLYEADTITRLAPSDPAATRELLADLLFDHDWARGISHDQRERAQELFGLEGVMRDWRTFLGLPVAFEGWQDRTPYFAEAAS